MPDKKSLARRERRRRRSFNMKSTKGRKGWYICVFLIENQDFPDVSPFRPEGVCMEEGEASGIGGSLGLGTMVPKTKNETAFPPRRPSPIGSPTAPSFDHLCKRVCILQFSHDLPHTDVSPFGGGRRGRTPQHISEPFPARRHCTDKSLISSVPRPLNLAKLT